MKLVRHLTVATALVVPATVAAFRPSASATETPEVGAPAVASQDGQMSPEDIAEMMAEAAKYTQPGPEHAFLGLLVGDWDVESRFTMMGANGPAEKGTATTRWKVEGRWLESTWSGSVMGMPGRQFSVLGYDRLKQSFVWTGYSDFDTAMNHAEGDLTPDGDTLILWGTLDEYLTGEHDKMVKYVHRFDGERDEAGALTSVDRIVLEVHDMPIGEEDTKVLEFTYTRREE